MSRICLVTKSAKLSNQSELPARLRCLSVADGTRSSWSKLGLATRSRSRRVETRDVFDLFLRYSSSFQDLSGAKCDLQCPAVGPQCFAQDHSCWASLETTTIPGKQRSLAVDIRRGRIAISEVGNDLRPGISGRTFTWPKALGKAVQTDEPGRTGHAFAAESDKSTQGVASALCGLGLAAEKGKRGWMRLAFHVCTWRLHVRPEGKWF